MRTQIVLLTLFLMATELTAKTYQVRMLNGLDGQTMLFDPMFLKIAPGDEIHFIPTDAGHNAQSIHLPEGAKEFKSEDGKEFRLKANTQGVYVYECKNHAIMGMFGVIQVGEVTNKARALEFLQSYKNKMMMAYQLNQNLMLL